ncbi:N-acetyltransferase [Amylibacter ulvae]|uniref:N-acetyltransferase n=1 Tax=Paramylibacter ulvae TaxID=1651968 RepID=A0ABQ3D7P3_9RHOB|nr:GNAT family N-acetyltransferase [Amylibacter ulvae]GHA60458.1 N-acetyltransferase [Amylibacter ulvae]
MPKFQIAPRLETERLVLRAHIKDDLDASLNMWRDELVYRHISGQAATTETAWQRLLRFSGHWVLMGYGYWLVETHAGEFIGEVGFADYKRDMTPPLGHRPEAGWVLSPSAHGKGYASEAMFAALQWLDQMVSDPSSVCIIAPENQTSVRLAEKLGYSKDGIGQYAGEDTLILSRPRFG